MRAPRSLGVEPVGAIPYVTRSPHQCSPRRSRPSQVPPIGPSFSSSSPKTLRSISASSTQRHSFGRYVFLAGPVHDRFVSLSRSISRGAFVPEGKGTLRREDCLHRPAGASNALLFHADPATWRYDPRTHEVCDQQRGLDLAQAASYMHLDRRSGPRFPSHRSR